MNVWVEQDDVMFYVSRSGSFDENNCLLKQGRFRLRLTPNPFTDTTAFRQTLVLKDGYVRLEGKDVSMSIWTDVFHPVIHVEIDAKEKVEWQLDYENWRYKDRPVRQGEGQQCSYKWAIPEGLVTTRDSVRSEARSLTFFHQNPERTVFDVVMEQQGMGSMKSQLYNPIRQLIFGGRLSGDNLIFSHTREGSYAGTDYKAWCYRSQRPARRQAVSIALHTSQESPMEWEASLARTENSVRLAKDKQATRAWWNQFWQRSFIEGEGEPGTAIRNYTLFRYMLGCNAYGQWPTKFNGGLFTFDPIYVDEKSNFTPDFRKWGGGTMTAQNQRLVYWPMLKSGDYDLMKPQLDCYNRLLPAAEARTRIYWGHAGACFTEQIENFGLPNPAEYGFKRPSG